MAWVPPANGLESEPCLTQLHKIQPWFRIGFSKTEEYLQTGRVVSIIDIEQSARDRGEKPPGTSGTFLITYESGLRAIWKPGWGYVAEVYAYRAARAIGLRLIPPTVFRDLTAADVDVRQIDSQTWNKVCGRRGSAQFFVDTPYDVRHNWKERERIWAEVPAKQKSDREIFYFIFGNWDRHWGNILVAARYDLVMIDNAAIISHQRVQFGQLPFRRVMRLRHEVRKAPDADPFPFGSAKQFKDPTLTELSEYFSRYGSTAAVDNLISQLKTKKDRTMAVVIWDNSVWVQAIGYQNYGVIKPAIYSESTLAAYRRLDFKILRRIFPQDEQNFTDDYIHAILERRDQLLAAADGQPRMP